MHKKVQCHRQDLYLKSLELGLKPIVVINKIDKPASDCQRVHDEVFELFLELGANDEQLDFTTVYAIGRDGVAMKKVDDEKINLEPLLDTILEKVPKTEGSVENPFLAQVFNLAYDNFLGRMAVARVYEGEAKVNETILVKDPFTGDTNSGKITKIYTFIGIKKIESESAKAGDIVMIAGFPSIFIGESFIKDPSTEGKPAIHIDEPTISLNFLVK